LASIKPREIPKIIDVGGRRGAVEKIGTTWQNAGYPGAWTEKDKTAPNNDNIPRWRSHDGTVTDKERETMRWVKPVKRAMLRGELARKARSWGTHICMANGGVTAV